MARISSIRSTGIQVSTANRAKHDSLPNGRPRYSQLTVAVEGSLALSGEWVLRKYKNGDTKEEIFLERLTVEQAIAPERLGANEEEQRGAAPPQQEFEPQRPAGSPKRKASATGKGAEVVQKKPRTNGSHPRSEAQRQPAAQPSSGEKAPAAVNTNDGGNDFKKLFGELYHDEMEHQEARLEGETGAKQTEKEQEQLAVQTDGEIREEALEELGEVDEDLLNEFDKANKTAKQRAEPRLQREVQQAVQPEVQEEAQSEIQQNIQQAVKQKPAATRHQPRRGGSDAKPINYASASFAHRLNPGNTRDNGTRSRARSSLLAEHPPSVPQGGSADDISKAKQRSGGQTSKSTKTDRKASIFDSMTDKEIAQHRARLDYYQRKIFDQRFGTGSKDQTAVETDETPVPTTQEKVVKLKPATKPMTKNRDNGPSNSTKR